MPLERFINCVVDDNLFSLVISGEPTAEQLLDAWNTIQSEYADCMGNSEYNLYKSVFKEVSILEITIKQIEILIGRDNQPNGLLWLIKDEQLEAELNSYLKTTFKFDDKREEELKKCVRFAKQLKLKSEIKKQMLEGMQKKNEDNGRPTREYFISVLVNLSDHSGYPVGQDITVYEFCTRIKKLMEAAKKTEELNKKVRNG